MKRDQEPSDQLSVKREKLTLCLFKSFLSCATEKENLFMSIVLHREGR